MYGTLVPALLMRRAICIFRELERTSQYSKGAGGQTKYLGVSVSKELSEMCPLGEKMAKIWLKLQENGKKKSQMAKVMAKEKYIS